jgi:hypothetical protein
MEKADIFFVYLEYIKAILINLWPLGNSVAIRYIFPSFGILCQEKSGNPDKKLFVRNNSLTPALPRSLN